MLKAYLQRRPSVQLVLAFAALIALGALLLSLPGMQEPAGQHGLITALFTATSAVCVTGLTVVDTGTEFSPAGQVVVLVLIQLGGLGILTVSTWTILTLGKRRLGLAGRMVLEETHGSLADIDPGRLLKQIILFTFVTEAVGTLLLFFRFLFDYPAPRALWLALFHAVSAFCNAGFCLFPDSLTSYQQDLYVNVVIMALIIAGGLGFIVVSDLIQRARTPKGQITLSLHTRTVLWMTAVLLVSGFCLFFLFEGADAEGGLSLEDRILPSAFLSVTSRTAGFNSIDTGSLGNASLLVLILFMIIGASPGSTGGGVKTTTIAIVLAMLRSNLRNRTRTEIFCRTIPRDLVAKALTILIAFIGTVAVVSLLIELAEFGHFSQDMVRDRFLEHLFEVVSALGTVGLSTGITAQLTSVSKSLLMVCMFVGRLGPLLIADSLIGMRKELDYRYPEERTMVG
ncbi:TrkH family potassium uptake protein [Acidobacteriota bacterium]